MGLKVWGKMYRVVTGNNSFKYKLYFLKLRSGLYFLTS